MKKIILKNTDEKIAFYTFNSKCCLNGKHFSLQFLSHLKLQGVSISFIKRKAAVSTKKFWHKILATWAVWMQLSQNRK